jgi:hypothetical protein
MHLLDPSGAPPHTSIVLRTRLDSHIDNLQPWHYSSFEWNQLFAEPSKYESAGAVRVSELCPVYNCHGFTFASRRTQVDEVGESTIARILADDGFVEVPEPQTRLGDVVVYYDDSGVAQHSGMVIGRADMNIPKIWSKWGKGYEWVHPLGVCLWGGMTTKFYRMTKWKFEEVFKVSS